MLEIVATLGFVLLLSAFGLNAAGWMDRSSMVYYGMNAIGAAILTWYAIVHEAPVFVLLEGTWASIASVSLIVGLFRARSRRAEVRNQRALS